MRALLAFSHGADRVSRAAGVVADYLVLLACVVSAGNAITRYVFNWSSNGLLEIQWYMFAGMVMLGASYTLLRNEHVRVDLLYGSRSERGKLWTDVFGLVVFLIPCMAALALWTWGLFWRSWVSGETSSNAGGLVRWPVMLLLPLGFGLLTIQGLAELVKRAALLRGVDPGGETVTAYEKPVQ